jgi:hypothetical protein
MLPMGHSSTTIDYMTDRSIAMDTTAPRRRTLRGASAVLVAGAVVLGLTWAAVGPAGAGTTAAATPSGTLLRSGTSLYPRAVRLSHSPTANGRIISAVVTFSGNSGRETFSESTNDGASFAQVGTAAPPASANGGGLCCGSLYELPAKVGALPAGTLLWAGSTGSDATNRRMALQVWQSQDTARTWSYLSSCAVAGNTGGLWEPELAVDAAGRLECFYSDETNPTLHSQSLRRVSSADGVRWSTPSDVVAVASQAARPGMPTVRKLPSGRYLMTYELCGTNGCQAYLRGSPDGIDWGAATDIGTRVTAVDGQYFAHAPTLAWVDNRTANGRLLLVGQMLFNTAGGVSGGNGHTLFVNTEGGSGGWYEITAPVSVPDPYDNYCPNYSSTLVPSADGIRALEIATGYAGTTCQAYFGTASITGTAATDTAVSGSTYRFVNVQSRLCLDVAGDSRQVGGRIEQWTCNGLGPQNFVATSAGSGYYTLRGQNSGLCVEVVGGSTTAGAAVDQGTCAGTGGQLWRLTSVGTGYLTAVNRTSAQCLDVTAGSVTPGANIEQWTCNNQSPQIWSLQQR